MKGSVEISGPLHTGMIRIGTEEVGFYDRRHNRTIWENEGKIDFQGVTRIKYGASIIVAEGANLLLGEGFRISSASSIICYKSIEFGENCRISWETQILDTDFHKVFNEKKEHINPDKEIRIGNDCWIGHHSIIRKGTNLGDMVVIASNSMVNGNIPEHNVILAGSPAKIIKTSITWGE